MFTRTTGLFIVPIWLTAMGWLVAHDIWPTLMAQEPPRLLSSEWLKQEGKHTQYSVLSDGNRIGTIWTRYSVNEDTVRCNDLIWIERLPLPFAPLRVTAESVFTHDGMLDELTVELQTYGTYFKFHGERFHTDFAFSYESGPIEGAFKIPLTDGEMIAGAFHPFGQLANLREGQVWKMQVLNPIADLVGIGDRFVSVLVEVTGSETISTPEGRRHCFIVESPSSKAWVNGHGEVLVQETTLPMVGSIRIVREAGFDENELNRRRRQVFSHGLETTP